MATVVGICNRALQKIGATRITGLDQGTKNANECNDAYEPLRDRLLRSHYWNFATRRAKLAQLSEVPASEWDHFYALPDDWLRTVEIHGNDAGAGRASYAHEDGKVASSFDELWMIYIAQITDPNTMTSDFREYLSVALAHDLAISIGNSGTQKDRLKVDLRDAKLLAISTDAQDDPPEDWPDGDWITARMGSG